MFRPPLTPDPNAHIGPLHGPWPELSTDKLNREIAELVATHQYSYGGMCGGCTNHACHFIDDTDEHDMGFADHLVYELIKFLGIGHNWTFQGREHDPEPCEDDPYCHRADRIPTRTD